MEKTKFKKLLFDIACSAVACDGHIDEREIRELQYIDKSTTYFKDIDMSKTLSRFVNNFTSNPKEITNNIIRELNESLLKPIEELLVLEIVLRLVYADTKIDEREKQYIQSIRACLSLDDTMITQRFGVIDFLIQYDENIAVSEKKSKRNSKSIDMTSLENMYVNFSENKNWRRNFNEITTSLITGFDEGKEISVPDF